MNVATEKDKPAIGVECPRCGCVDSRVLQTRKRELTINGKRKGGIRRERRCLNCGKAFWTSES